jgi:hypothetical protein
MLSSPEPNLLPFTNISSYLTETGIETVLVTHLFSTMKSFVRTLFETEYFSSMTGILKSGGSAGFFCIFKFPQTAFAHHRILGKPAR